MKTNLLFLLIFLLPFSTFAQVKTTSSDEQNVWLKNVKKKDPNETYSERDYPDDLYYGIENFSDYNYYQTNGRIAPGVTEMSDSRYESISKWTPYYDRPSNCSTADYKPELNRVFSTPGMPTKNGAAVIQRQPRPLYSKTAYLSKTEGAIKLNIQLKADGTIGKITPSNSLPNGLTESAVKAACYITFYPAAANKKYVDSIKTVVYTFSLDQVEEPGLSDQPKASLNTEIKITSKPRPEYTMQARRNQTSGTVTMRVTFLASGEIGAIVPVKTLADGLTENAVEAAKLMKFEPAKKNGVNYTTTKLISYSFSIY